MPRIKQPKTPKVLLAPEANGKSTVTDAQIDAALTKREPVIKLEDLLSTGSTQLNLGISGRAEGGIPKGSTVLFVGDSDAGKSYMSMVFFAEAARNGMFDNYAFYYNNKEDGAKMDMVAHFGRRAAERIEPPGRFKDGTPKHSVTVEDWYDHLDDLFKLGEPFIEVLDSETALSSEAQLKKQAANKAVRRKKEAKAEGEEIEDNSEDNSEGGTGGKEQNTIKGQMTDGKAVVHSQRLKDAVYKAERLGAIIILLCQTRQNIGFGATFNPRVRAGGDAMKFGSGIEIWAKVHAQIKRTVMGKERHIGNMSEMSIRRSRLTGRKMSVMVPLYYGNVDVPGSSGVDDVGSCISYLVDEGHWKGEMHKFNGMALKVEAPEFTFRGTAEKLAQLIEERDEEPKLRALVQETWDTIEAQCIVRRKQRYV